ncbi:lipopolysaccharide biosynthesis protein [Haloarcula onubensis]|uniref:Lipopolysaccharide biosynthesis protein n=1 Tax=Haloarcula onubensis TaxID=2950539 RepID=A0ABU2FNG4_9EURY|nr:lipopolysaccharide biosynthesis protein [Halomicroarcula sp. S3CR25-11]MDS0281797.1 lipopolysaccharide biosynthesis protein [Halomicroarcula sp. S3CR25-11]
MSRGRAVLRRLRSILTPGSGVTDRTVTGGVWMGLNNVADRALQLGTILFLAGLLSPAAFGLYGIALVVQSALQRLSQLGLDTALIRRRESDVDRYLDTVWTVELGRGLLLGTVLYAAAPLVGSVFGEPRVVSLLRVLALTPVLDGLRNPGVVYLVKDLEFHRDAAYKLSNRVAYTLVGVGVGYATRSVWALVAAMLAAQCTSLVVSYLVHDYRPWLRFDFAAARELFEYGRWIFTSEGLMFLINEGDDAFVGWLLGSATLGIYQLSYRLSNAPTTEITHPIQQVLFPAYAKVQDDDASLRQGYYTSVRVITLLSFPAAVGIVLVGPVFVPALLGGEWLPMVVPMQVFAVYAGLRSFRSATVPLFRAIDRPDYDTKIRLLKLALLAPFVYPAASAFGATGVALVILGHTVVVAPIASYLAVRSVDGRLTTLGRILSYPAIASGAMGVVVYLVRERLVGVPSLVELPLLVLVGVITYGAAVAALEQRFGIGLAPIYRTFQDWVAGTA